MLYWLLILNYVNNIFCALEGGHEQNEKGNKTKPTSSTTATEDDISSTTILTSTKYVEASTTTSRSNKENGELILNLKTTANDSLLNQTVANNLTLNLMTFTAIPFAARSRRTLLDLIITKIVKYVTVSRTTPKSTIPDLHSVYLKSKLIRDLIKKKMIKYKKRKINNRKIDEKLGKKRGIPEKIIKTTKRVPMKESKYYIRKYVRKNLYKMTTTTPKPTRDPWLYWTKEKVTKKKKSKLQRLLELYKLKQDRAV